MTRLIQWQSCVLCAALLASASVSAGPITFNSALPVAKDGIINREKLLIRRLKVTPHWPIAIWR